MLKSINRLFKLAGKYRGKMIVSVICAIGSVASGIIPYFFISQFVDEIARHETPRTNLYLATIAVGGFLILKTVLFSLSTLLSHQVAYRILKNVRLQLAEKLTRLPLGYVLERDSGIIKKNMENDVEELERFLAHNIPETVSSFAVPVAVILYLAFIDWRMALSMIACIPFALFFYTLMMRGNKEKMQKYYRSVDKMNAVVVEYVNGMKEIKAFNQSEHSFSRFKNAIEEYRRYVLDWYKSCWPLMSAYFVLTQASIVTVLPVGLYFMMNNSLDLSIFILFLLISLGFAAPLIKLTEFADGITLVVNAEQNIYSIISEKELSSTDAQLTPKNTKITFCDVSFSYDGKKEVLKKISFIADENLSLAIIGASGSGKSTIAKLICRFWDIDSGEISIGGVDIQKMKPDQLMNMISFVFQDTFLFNISIAENIRIGRPQASDNQLIEAAKLAQCHDFITKMKNGYASLAGDGGSRLSGGERQRICIARAILKNAPILVLDEATASIDPDCEEQIQDAIGVLAQNKTIIVIAHRIRTIMGFDKILVLQNGKICASGTHNDLLKTSAEYQNIFNAYTHTENWVVSTKKGDVVC